MLLVFTLLLVLLRLQQLPLLLELCFALNPRLACYLEGAAAGGSVQPPLLLLLSQLATSFWKEMPEGRPNIRGRQQDALQIWGTRP